MEDREFEPGEVRVYYEISIPQGATLWVPVDHQTSGLRKLAEPSELADCRRILESHPSRLIPDARLRQAELLQRLRQGNIRAQCEVVRDLYVHGDDNSWYGKIANFFQQTQAVLCQEWAVVEGITFEAAQVEIHSLLEKSRHSVTRSKA